MHETIISKQIIEDAKAYGNVSAITIEVGDLAHLPIEELKPTLGGMVDWDITYVRKPARVECECGYRGAPEILMHTHDHTLFKCPKCGKVPQVIEGQHIKLKKVEVED
jgi:Zn finger protein HypA/HybF involved in hydrogenase expression